LANYYLQQGDDTSLTYNLDIVGDLDIGLPSLDYKLVDIKGEGGQLQGVGTQKGRVLEFSYFFKRNEEYERDEFLDWLTKGSEITLYCYKTVDKRVRCSITNTSTEVKVIGINSTQQLKQLSTGDSITGVGIPDNTVIDTINSTSFLIDQAATASLNDTWLQARTFTGRTRVYPQPKGGEAYKVNRLSESVNFSCISKNPFFTSTTLTITEFDSTSKTEKSTTININGYRTPIIVDFTPNESFSVLQVKTSDSFGFKASRAFQSGETISVNTGNSELTMTIDGNTVTGIFDADSTPFMLEKTTNVLSIIASNSTDGALKIKYYERRI